MTQTVKGPPPHPKSRAEVREERMREPLEVAEPASPRAHSTVNSGFSICVILVYYLDIAPGIV